MTIRYSTSLSDDGSPNSLPIYKECELLELPPLKCLYLFSYQALVHHATGNLAKAGPNSENHQIQAQRFILRSDDRPLFWLLIFQAHSDGTRNFDLV